MRKEEGKYVPVLFPVLLRSLLYCWKIDSQSTRLEIGGLATQYPSIPPTFFYLN
jgi:hypothetical protein